MNNFSPEAQRFLARLIQAEDPNVLTPPDELHDEVWEHYAYLCGFYSGKTGDTYDRDLFYGPWTALDPDEELPSAFRDAFFVIIEAHKKLDAGEEADLSDEAMDKQYDQWQELPQAARDSLKYLSAYLNGFRDGERNTPHFHPEIAKLRDTYNGLLSSPAS